MDSIMLMIVGYIAWCGLAFVLARFVKMETSSHKPISFLYIILAAPMVIVDIITGKGTIR